MANHASAKKRVRRNKSKALVNKSRVSRIRTQVKKIEQAIGAGDNKAAAEALKVAQPEIYRGVSKGVLNKKAAARKMSRLSKRIKALKKAS
jgi:small subunit ribosomal protein S20